MKPNSSTETPRTLRSPTAGPCFTSTRKSCWLLQTPKPGRSDSAFKAPPTPCNRIPPTSGSIYYHTLISQFQATYPDIVLQITEVPSRRILSLLDEGQLDLGVVLEPISREAYVTRPVVRSEIVAVVSRDHPLAGCGTISLSRLRDEPLLMISQDFMFSGVVEGLCRQAGFAPQVAFESSQWDLLYEMALDGRGVAFFPKALMDKHPRSEAVCLHLQDPAAPWILSVAYRKERFLSTPMQLFLELCKP